MAFSAFGFEMAEADLRALCDCTFLGTDALNAVEAARQLGFANTSRQNLSFDDLIALLRDGECPIVYVDLRPINGIGGQHALVVVEIGSDAVTVLDPFVGERLLPREDFQRAWEWQRRLTIIVK
ncbi:MAG: cysteine peptidase family C39 domain-containing protein [Blastocatellia bacterium]